MGINDCFSTDWRITGFSLVSYLTNPAGYWSIFITPLASFVSNPTLQYSLFSFFFFLVNFVWTLILLTIPRLNFITYVFKINDSAMCYLESITSKFVIEKIARLLAVLHLDAFLLFWLRLLLLSNKVAFLWREIIWNFHFLKSAFSSHDMDTLFKSLMIEDNFSLLWIILSFVSSCHK